MDEWIELTPRRMALPPAAGRVTMALVPPPGRGAAMVRVNLSRVILEALGWKVKGMLTIRHSPDGSKVRISPAAKGVEGYVLGERGTTGTLNFRLPWLFGPRDAVPSETVEHVLHTAESVLIANMPAWGRPNGVSTTPLMVKNPGGSRGQAKAAAPPASPPVCLTAEEAAAEAECEGKDLLRKGRSVREIAALLNEDMDTVREWKRQVDAGA